MNRRNYTTMTLDDHRAAAREMATVHRSVAEFNSWYGHTDQTVLEACK